MKTLARPAIDESGALRAPIAGTNAASNCNSPSISHCGPHCFASSVARKTFVTRGCSALPFVEKDNIATRGGVPTNFSWLAAVVTAISASCSLVGSGTTAQSANVRHGPPAASITKQLETKLRPGGVPIPYKPARITRAVVERLPATPASASPIRTNNAASNSGSLTACRAASRESPLCCRFSNSCCAQRSRSESSCVETTDRLSRVANRFSGGSTNLIRHSDWSNNT